MAEARDRGFTLMETIVVVVLVAVIASVMAAVVAVILRNSPATEASTDNSRSYQRLATWLPRDAASTPPPGFEFGGASPVCDGADAGVSLVQMTWAPNDGKGTTFASDYRFTPSPAGSPVMRYTCSGPDPSPPYSGTAAREVTSTVKNAEATPTTSGAGVMMRLTTCGDAQCSVNGPMITLEAGSRNPADTLP